MEELIKYYTEHGQEHVFQFLPQLTEGEKSFLMQDLKGIDLGELNRIYKSVAEAKVTTKPKLEPFPDVCKVVGTERQRDAWEQLGLQKIKEGKLAILLLAGGQGTRLGTVYPKGMYDVGLPSAKSLFQLQAERLIRVQQIAAGSGSSVDVVVPWYIMTSESTKETTQDFFSQHGYFGIDPKNIYFFEQGMLPCVTPGGKIIMESTFKVAKAPNGNGNMYAALHLSGALADMKKRGVEMVYQYSVDNILVKMADPVFAGFCFDTGADCAAKVVPKSHPEESVGVLCMVDDKPGVIEYSEIDKETATSVDQAGNLRFNAGHVCMNMYSVPFLERIYSQLDILPYHVAKKKIPAVNSEGKTKTPSENNGWKLEQFIFDVFGMASNMKAMEVVREDEFSPLKNGPGAAVDSPSSCRKSLSDLHKKFIRTSGGIIRTESEESLVEVSPLVTYNGEGLEAVVRGRTFTGENVHIEN